ncbi:uncharacterized protein LOC120258907 isoform X2 [Dioscorea cayenensis subsp. rotundata]|nr:uncharacterized protein LOC120258907 isoform X2 [Dioscorea cayenensis subsp. rotundata]
MQSIEVLLEMSENVYWYQYKQLNPYQPPDYAWSKRNNLRKVQKAKRKTKYVREETKCGSNIIKPVYAKHRGSLGNVRKCVLVNPVRTKELTNICVPGKDENVRLSPPRLMSLEEAIGYVASDELIEVHPYTFSNENIFLHFNFHEDAYAQFDYWIKAIGVDGLFTDFTGSLHRHQEWTTSVLGKDDKNSITLLHKIALLITSQEGVI